jgi:hypothetical protein
MRMHVTIRTKMHRTNGSSAVARTATLTHMSDILHITTTGIFAFQVYCARLLCLESARFLVQMNFELAAVAVAR